MANAPMVIPFSKGSMRVRDQVLLILSTEFPLSLKQLYANISRQGINVSYQAVHKVVQELLSEGIIERKEKGYQLNQNWIQQVKDYAMNVNTIYTKGENYSIPKKFEKLQFTFSDMSTFIVWLAETLRDLSLTDFKPVKALGLFDHLLWPLRFNFMDFELLRQMIAANPETVAVSCHATPFDKWVGKNYKLAGMTKVKVGIPNLKVDEDVLIHGDTIIQMKYSKETKEFMDKYYEKISNLQEMFMFYFSDPMKNQKFHIEVTIQRNAGLSRMIEKQIRGYFNEEKK